MSGGAQRATGSTAPAPGTGDTAPVVATAAGIPRAGDSPGASDVASAGIPTSAKTGAAGRVPTAAGVAGAVRLAAALLVAAGVLACTPPEAARIRGGGPGADVGNRDAVVEMHGGSNMYWKTPCKATEAQCPGPLPTAGTPERDRLLRRWPS